MMIEIVKLLLLLAVAVVANMLLGAYKNVQVENAKFDKNKFFNGLVKGMIVGFAFFALALILMYLPELSIALGVEANMMIYIAISIYVKKIVTSLMNIFGMKSVTEITKEEDYL